jgi:hypothetical protein
MTPPQITLNTAALHSCIRCWIVFLFLTTICDATTCYAGMFWNTSDSGTSACASYAAGKYSDSGASACTSCSAGKYAERQVLPPGLRGLANSIAVSKLEEWTLAGIGEWKLGNTGQSCDVVCNNHNLQCLALDLGQQPSLEVSGLPVARTGPTYRSSLPPQPASGPC